MNLRTIAYAASLGLIGSVVGAVSLQSADAVVEKYLSAVGGRDALGKLTSRRATGTVAVESAIGVLTGSIEVDNKLPNKSRSFITLDLRAVGATSMTLEQKFDGTRGYVLNSMQGNSEMTGLQLENARNNLFPTPLLSYRDRGARIELLPGEKLAGRDMAVLKTVPASGAAVTMYFDVESGLLARTVSTVDSPQVGGPIEQTSDLSDYRAVDGFKVPFRIVNRNAAQTVTITLTKVEHNVAIDDALFGRQ